MSINLEINYLAVFVSAVLNFVLGGLWYSPVLFGNLFVKIMAWDEAKLKQIKEKGATMPYVWAFLAALVMSFVLALLISMLDIEGFPAGAILGFLIGLGFVVTTHLATVTFEERKFGLYGIQAAYYWVSLILMGGLLSAWQ